MVSAAEPDQGFPFGRARTVRRWGVARDGGWRSRRKPIHLCGAFSLLEELREALARLAPRLDVVPAGAEDQPVVLPQP